MTNLALVAVRVVQLATPLANDSTRLSRDELLTPPTVAALASTSDILSRYASNFSKVSGGGAAPAKEV